MSNLEPLVSVPWLARQLDNPKIKIIDCRFQLANPDWGYQQYLTGHIPGAYFLDLNQDLSSPVQEKGGRHPLPDFAKLAQKLEKMGIVSGETSIIVYDDARFAFAARAWWLLRYLGHPQVALLDGGIKAWEAMENPLSQAIPPSAPGNFCTSVGSDGVIDIDTLKARQNLGTMVLIDSREAARYRGEVEPIDPIAGHILGAVNSPWLLVSDSAGYLQPISSQQQLWQAYEPGQEIVVYCGSGVTACVNLFSLFLAGYHNVKLYPGGWSDWCSYLC